MKLKFILPLLVILLFGPMIGFHLGLLNKSIDDEPKVAMVLGAGILNNTTPTAVLKNRLNRAVELWEDEKVTYILVSGDNREQYHDEPKVMKNYLMDQGVPEEVIIPDFAGRRTIDSCWRARNVFNVESLYVITQNFHLPRATYLCRNLGLDVTPIEAKNSSYQGGFNGYVREIGATWVAFVESFGYSGATKGDGSEPDLSK